MHETDKLIEKVILIAVDNANGTVETEDSLIELKELAQTAGVEVIGELVQKRDGVHRAYYFGKGKLQELSDLIIETGATGIIADDELTNSQIKNMEKMLDTKIMDRTLLILDIFAKNASTAEGRAQVELAQLKYNLGHLAGIGASLSRLGGGIGTRGPGEKKLEVDKRRIREQISELNKQLEDIQTHRKVTREKRERSEVPVVAMVGYTNAGKSTLMNCLTSAGVLAEDKLFATLDTISRKLSLKGGSEALFSDTVGFINKLPHALIKAFDATLSELKFADIIVHVVDSSAKIIDEQISIVYKTLEALGCIDKPIITVFNKIDKEITYPLPVDKHAVETVNISALTGQNIDELLEIVEKIINTFKKKVKVLIPYSEGTLINYIHSGCEILNEEHTEEGTVIELFADDKTFNKLSKHFI
ncbi:MAG: GTPase HflX [Defluviitaleaceae bacterium]|nr:GTPase HflX [Defluviitaleaceae bacterium]